MDTEVVFDKMTITIKNLILFLLISHITYVQTIKETDIVTESEIREDVPELHTVGYRPFSPHEDPRLTYNVDPDYMPVEDPPIVVTTKFEPPYMMMKKSQSMFLTGNDRYEGFLADVLSDLSARAGIPYVIRLCRDGVYGTEGENGTWAGMIGEIYRNEADLAVGALTVTPQRKKVVQFTVPFMSFQSAAVLKRSRSNRNKHERVPRSKQQKLRTLEDLHQSRIPYGVVSGGLTAKQFENSTDPMLNAMWSQMLNSWPSTFVYSDQEGVQRAEHENYAFITNSALAEYVTVRKPCHLYKTGNFLDRQFYAFAVSHNSPLKDTLDTFLTQMRDDGTIHSLYRKWWTNECDRKRDAKDVEGVKGGNGKTTLSPWRYATAQTFELHNAAETKTSSNIVSLCTVIFLLCLTSLHK